MQMHSLAFDVSHTLAGGLVLISLMMLYQDRLYSLLNVFALHALVLSLSVAWQAFIQDAPHLYVTAAIALLFKAIAIPVALHRMIVKLGIHRGIETVTGIGMTMLAGVGLVALSLVVALRATAGERSRRAAQRASSNAATPPATSASANCQPSCARTDRGCPSLTIPGSVAANPSTAAAGTTAAPRPSSANAASRERTRKAIAAATAKTMPLREYVRATATIAPYASTAPSARRRPNHHSPSGSSASAACASAFQ